MKTEITSRFRASIRSLSHGLLLLLVLFPTVGSLYAGLDATVNWGGPDFQIRNSTHFPIKITAEVSDGHVKVSILGTEERNYYVEMETEVQWGRSTIHAKSFKCKYDRETNKLISRDLEAQSNYMR